MIKHQFRAAALHLLPSQANIVKHGLVLNGLTVDLRQLHAHEHPGHEEAEENADKTDEQQQEAVQFGDVWRVGAVQDYKAQAAHREEETGGQSFHDVLPVYSGKQMQIHQLWMRLIIRAA